MIKLYIIGLFLMSLTTVYALILSRANRWLVFILIPFLMVMSLYTWRAINVMQGTPINGLPYGKNVEILWTYNEKPAIYLLVRHENQIVPKYYMTDWTLDSAIGANEIQGDIDNDLPVEGKFVKPSAGGESGEGSLRDFESMNSFQSLNPKALN